MKKEGVVKILLYSFLFVFLSSGIFAVAPTPGTCAISLRTECLEADGNYILMGLSSLTNAHGEFPDAGTYDYVLCCAVGDGNTTCDSGGLNKIIGLSSDTNAHGEGTSQPNYLTKVCYGHLSCMETTFDCGVEENGTGEYPLGILSLSSSSNAHIGAIEDYPVKICCEIPDYPPTTNLIFPTNNSNEDEEVIFNCSATDDNNLVNITLYGNWNGVWHANETKLLTGTFNSTTFTKSLTDGIYQWNCLTFDNSSKGDWADINWTVNIDHITPNVNIISPLNQAYNFSSIDFNVTINEDGTCEYSLDNGITNVSMGTIDNRNFSATNSSMLNGNYTVNFYCKDVAGNLNYTEGVSFNVNALPDTYKFYIKTPGYTVAWLGNFGNIVLKGKCFSGGNCDNPGPDSFIIRNITNDNIAFINSTGDLCIEKGDCSDESPTCNSIRDAFIIKNSSNYNMSYIDFDGDLCLTGKLYENSGYV